MPTDAAKPDAWLGHQVCECSSLGLPTFCCCCCSCCHRGHCCCCCKAAAPSPAPLVYEADPAKEDEPAVLMGRDGGEAGMGDSTKALRPPMPPSLNPAPMPCWRPRLELLLESHRTGPDVVTAATAAERLGALLPLLLLLPPTVHSVVGPTESCRGLPAPEGLWEAIEGASLARPNAGAAEVCGNENATTELMCGCCC